MPSRGYVAVAPDRLGDALAQWLSGHHAVLRVAIDGPGCARPDAIGDALIDPLKARGHPVAHVRAQWFWRDASLRLEHGREDVDSYPSWLDADALRREVLVPVRGGKYLPSLRNPVTNRSTRAAPARLGERGVLVVSGELLLGRDLPFDRTVHLAMSAAARERHTPADQGWTLPAFERYDAEVRPQDVADVVIRMDDPRHPAVAGLR